MAAPQTHQACNRPGRPFCDKVCDRIALSAASLLKITVLYTEARDKGL